VLDNGDNILKKTVTTAAVPAVAGSQNVDSSAAKLRK